MLVLGNGDAAEPKRRLVARAGGIIVDDQARAIDEGVRIAFVAYEDAKACEVAAINLRCAGMLVNVVDRPDLCDFTTPSILDRDPLLIAVGTGGASAGLAKHVRLRLERILPQSLGTLALAMKRLRPRLRELVPNGSDRRRAIDTALREGGRLDALDEGSAEKADEWVKSLHTMRGDHHENPEDHHHANIADFTLKSSDPEDLTLRQARLLGEADIVCVHGQIGTGILARARADAMRIRCDLNSCPRAADRNGTPQCIAKESASANPLTVILRPFDRDQIE